MNLKIWCLNIPHINELINRYILINMNYLSHNIGINTSDVPRLRRVVTFIFLINTKSECSIRVLILLFHSNIRFTH